MHKKLWRPDEQLLFKANFCYFISFVLRTTFFNFIFFRFNIARQRQDRYEKIGYKDDTAVCLLTLDPTSTKWKTGVQPKTTSRKKTRRSGNLK